PHPVDASPPSHPLGHYSPEILTLSHQEIRIFRGLVRVYSPEESAFSAPLLAQYSDSPPSGPGPDQYFTPGVGGLPSFRLKWD
ncbi:MAG: hypothetical protein ACE5IJ_03085, partial [Thermoplasmata archaeon]